MTISPLAPAHFPSLPEIKGVTRRVARAGYKDWLRFDLTLIEFSAGTAVAGVLTQSKCPSPEVNWCKEALKVGSARALIVNAGNANAFTGASGKQATDLMIDIVSKKLSCDPKQVYVSSTGVIGEPLPQDKAKDGLAEAFTAAPCSWEDAASTIMTTDTFAKAAQAQAIIGANTVNLVGIVKGSGMIAPDMATMLGYIFTDASVDSAFLQEMLSRANRKSFSCITVDSDTSTSDTVLAFATGSSGSNTSFILGG